MVRAKRRLSGRVLLVDDETAVRGFMQEMLAGWGLTVTTAAHAGEALSIFEEKEGAFDLVITDLAMPIKTGIELAAELRARCEDVPIILCSGYATDDAAFEAERYGIDTILGKPIEPAELRSAVEAALPA
ncbi:MAG TPA: response regulator, partial [Burkholderiaceae bacterium]|nr:response regulator [Burkholderiaceae bacterium]